MLPPPATPSPSTTDTRTARPRTGLTVTALVGGSAVALALPVQWLDVYWYIWVPPSPPSAGDGVRYLWTAGLAIALLLTAVVLAWLRGGGGLIALTSIALVCGLLGAFVFQVPKDRFSSGPPEPDDRDTHVCYGTTGDCPGG